MEQLAPARDLLPAVKSSFANKVAPEEDAPATATRAATDSARMYQSELDHVVRFFQLPPEQLATMFRYRSDMGVTVNTRRLGAAAPQFIDHLKQLGYEVEPRLGSNVFVTLPLQ